MQYFAYDMRKTQEKAVGAEQRIRNHPKEKSYLRIFFKKIFLAGKTGKGISYSKTLVCIRITLWKHRLLGLNFRVSDSASVRLS